MPDPAPAPNANPATLADLSRQIKSVAAVEEFLAGIGYLTPEVRAAVDGARAGFEDRAAAAIAAYSAGNNSPVPDVVTDGGDLYTVDSIQGKARLDRAVVVDAKDIPLTTPTPNPEPVPNPTP